MPHPRRTLTTISLAVALWWIAATAALALPGEGFGLDPYGVAPTDPAVTTSSTASTASSAFDPSLAQAVVAVVLVGLLLGIAGYLAGTARHHRAVAP